MRKLVLFLIVKHAKGVEILMVLSVFSGALGVVTGIRKPPTQSGKCRSLAFVLYSPSWAEGAGRIWPT